MIFDVCCVYTTHIKKACRPVFKFSIAWANRQGSVYDHEFVIGRLITYDHGKVLVANRAGNETVKVAKSSLNRRYIYKLRNCLEHVQTFKIFDNNLQT